MTTEQATDTTEAGAELTATSFDAALLRGLADQYDNNGRHHMAAALRRGAVAIDGQIARVDGWQQWHQGRKAEQPIGNSGPR